MNKVCSILMAGNLALLVAAPSDAKVSAEYIRWTKGEFDMPPAIKRVADTSELRPFLDSRDDFLRMAAVRRLGEIEGAAAVGLLVKVFKDQPSASGCDTFPLVRMEIIRTLGRVSGDKAKSALLKILAQYWKAGPDVKNKRGFRLDRDFASVVPLLLGELYKWSDDESVFQQAKKLALSEDVAQVYTQPGGIGDKAWQVYLKGLMDKQGYKQGKASAQFLLDFLDEITGKGYGDNTLTAVKVRAAEAILQRHSEDTLLSLKKAFRAEIRKEYAKGLERSKERCSRLSSRVGWLTRVLERKADEKRRKEKGKKKPTMPSSSQPSSGGTNQ